MPSPIRVNVVLFMLLIFPPSEVLVLCEVTLYTVRAARGFAIGMYLRRSWSGGLPARTWLYTQHGSGLGRRSSLVRVEDGVVEILTVLKQSDESSLVRVVIEAGCDLVRRDNNRNHRVGVLRDAVTCRYKVSEHV